MNRKKYYCRYKYGILICVLSLLLSACKKDFGGYYDYPEGLEGPIYQQLSSDTTFREFVKAIDKLPQFRQAINTSGLYTAFAPDNEAVRNYLLQKYAKRSFDEFNMSLEEDSIVVQNFVDAHFAMDMYFEYNFNKNISEDGIGKFKYHIRYKDPVYKYYDKDYKLWRKVTTENKMLMVYSQTFLERYRMHADYEAFFGRTPGTFNVEGAQVLADKKDIPAINGVIHGIDKVLEPRANLSRLLQQEQPDFYNLHDYLTFLKFDMSASLAEGKDGEDLDSLFIRSTIDDGDFDLNKESYFFSVFSPPADLFANYIQHTLLPGFSNSMDSIPFMTKMWLVAGYMTPGLVTSSYLKDGVTVISGDTVKNPAIKRTQMASNGVLYELNDFYLPAPFRTVTRGPMLHSNYLWFMDLMLMAANGYSIPNANVTYLSNRAKRFTFFVPHNRALRNIDGYDIVREVSENRTSFRKGGRRMTSRQMDSLVNYMIVPDIEIRPENLSSMHNRWIETRSGNFLQIENGKLGGNIPLVDYEETENGIIYYLNSHDMPIQPRNLMSAAIKKNFPDFYKIIKARKVDEEKGELSDDQTLEALLKQNAEMFTVFIPTDAALETYKTTHGLGDYDKDAKWGPIAKYLITKTRVYSDGAYKQDEAAMNPDPDDPSKFVSVHKNEIYLHDPTAIDQYSYFNVVFNGSMSIVAKDGETARVIPVRYNGRDVTDIETINGVIHQIDKVLTPPDQIFPDK